MSTPTRVAAGVPTGGQFAASALGESAVNLHTDTDTGIDTGTGSEEHRATVIREALGPGEPLSANDERLLAILCNPRVSEEIGASDDIEEVVEDLEGFGGDDTIFGAEQIAERLGAHTRLTGPDNGAGEMEVSMDRSESYGTESYGVSVYLGRDVGLRLSENHDIKYLDTRRLPVTGDSGLRRAVALASVLDGDYQRVLTKARGMGLVPQAPPTTLAEAETQRAEAEHTAGLAATEKDRANLTLAAFQVRDQYPGARYLVIGSAMDNDTNCYAHAVLGTDRKPIAYPEDTFAHPKTQALQQSVMDLPIGGLRRSVGINTEPWNDDEADDSYVVDLDDLAPSQASPTSPASQPQRPTQEGDR